MGIYLLLVWCTMAVSPAVCSGDLHGQPEPSLQDALNALGNVLDYCERNYQELNLDAVIGIRMVDGQLTVLSRRIEAGRLSAQPGQASQVEELQRQAARVADMTLPELQKSDPDYYERLSPILQPGFWVIDSRTRTTDPRLLSPPTVPRATPFNEEQSDSCLTELLGTSSKVSCEISPSCWSLMTSPGFQGYWLTHELFYLQIGEQAGCSHELSIHSAESGHRDGVRGMEAAYCANILREARGLAAAGFKQEDRDLFMEQGSCLSHKTGVAAGALAGYVRYILEYYRDLSQGDEGSH